MLGVIKFRMDVPIFYTFHIDGKLFLGRKNAKIFMVALIISEVEYITR